MLYTLGSRRQTDISGTQPDADRASRTPGQLWNGRANLPNEVLASRNMRNQRHEATGPKGADLTLKSTSLTPFYFRNFFPGPYTQASLG